MIKKLPANFGIYFFTALFFAMGSYFVMLDMSYVYMSSAGFIMLYIAVFYPEKTYMMLALFAPLSVNIEEFSDSLGMFIPTEPLLFGFMLLLLYQSTYQKIYDKRIWKHPITIAVITYLLWILVTSITSTMPGTSFKYLLARLWFIIPILFYGIGFFKENPKKIKQFIWLFCSSMTLVILFTLIKHAGYQFSEKEGHWVMSPFFKDHTIYGAIVALITPLLFGLLVLYWNTPLLRMTVLMMLGVTLIGLFFSYSRAAWVSIIAAILVLITILLKVKFKYLMATAAISTLIIYFSWDVIIYEMQKNDYEHTTDDFAEKLQSATNVSSDASNLERLNRWACAITMYKKKPLFGFGPGTYAFQYGPYQLASNKTIISTNLGDKGNAHSEYLGALSEMGLVGMLTFLGMVIAIFYGTLKVYNSWPTKDFEYKILILSMILALVTYFVHGLLNNFLDTDKAAIPVWAFTAAIIGLSYKKDDEKIAAKLESQKA